MTCLPNRILVTAPDYDLMTRYLSAWAQKLVTTISNGQRHVYHLKRDKVTRTEFEKYIKKNQPELIFLNGHGAADEIAGQDHKIILDLTNVNILKECTVYALSCKSAAKLGFAAINAGAEGYIGYTENFILVSQPNKTAHPNDDSVASLFLNPSNAIVSALCKGHTSKEAVTKGKQAYKRSIIKVLNSEIQTDLDRCVSYLLWDMQHLYNCAPVPPN